MLHDQYLVWSEEHGRWWRPAAQGYTSSIAEAGIYSKQQADMICRDANFGGSFHEIAIPMPEGLPDACG